MIIRIVLSNKETNDSLELKNIDTDDRASVLQKFKDVQKLGNWTHITYYDVMWEHTNDFKIISKQAKHWQNFKYWSSHLNNIQKRKLSKPTFSQVPEFHEEIYKEVDTTNKPIIDILHSWGIAGTGCTQRLNVRRAIAATKNILSGVSSPSVKLSY